MKGILKHYNSERGFGFIESEGLEKDVFFHISTLIEVRKPKDGDMIKFNVKETEKGLNAVDCMII